MERLTGVADENAATLYKVFNEIGRELVEAMTKHPTYPDDPLRRICIVAEELGEAVKETVDLTRPKVDRLEAMLIRRRLYNELKQTGVTVVRMMAAMKEEGGV